MSTNKTKQTTNTTTATGGGGGAATTARAAPATQHPRIPDAKIKPFWDALRDQDYSGAYAATLKVDKEIPNSPSLHSYALYAAFMQKNTKLMERHLVELRRLAPFELDVFHIIRFSIKRGVYMHVLTQLLETALKHDPKKIDLLRSLVTDSVRLGNYRRAQSAAAAVYTNGKENVALIWSATTISILLTQIANYIISPTLHEPASVLLSVEEAAKLKEQHSDKNEDEFDIEVAKLRYQNVMTLTTQAHIKQVAEISRAFKLIHALIRRAFFQTTDPKQMLINTAMSSNYPPNQNPLILNPTWFMQYYVLLHHQGLATNTMVQLERRLAGVSAKILQVDPTTILPKTNQLNIDPYGKLFHSHNRFPLPPMTPLVTTEDSTTGATVSAEDFLSLLPSFDTHSTLNTNTIQSVMQTVQLLDSPVAQDFATKHPQQWRQLKLQSLVQILTVYDINLDQPTTPEAEEQRIAESVPHTLEEQRARFDAKLKDIKQLCTELLYSWPNQWNVIALYTYIVVLEASQGWSVFKLSHFLSLFENNKTLQAVFLNELKFQSHPLALEPFSSQHSWDQIFIQNLVIDFTSHLQTFQHQFDLDEISQLKSNDLFHIKSNNYIDICALFPHPQPIPSRRLIRIKKVLVDLWIRGNTLPEKQEGCNFFDQYDDDSDDDSDSIRKAPQQPRSMGGAIFGNPTIDSSNFSGKYSSYGLLLALNEVNRLAMIYNTIVMFGSIQLSGNINANATIETLQWNHTATPDLLAVYQHHQSIICAHTIMDLCHYVMAYLDKPYFWSDIQYFLNQFSTIHTLSKAYPQLGPTFDALIPSFDVTLQEHSSALQQFCFDTITPYEDLESGNVTELEPYHEEFPSYQIKIICFTHGKRHTRTHHRFAITTLKYHFQKQTDALCDTSSSRTKQYVFISSWLDILLIYTNAFLFSANCQQILSDEIRAMTDRYEAETYELRLQDAQNELTKKWEEEEEAKKNANAGKNKNAKQNTTTKPSTPPIVAIPRQFTATERDYLTNCIDERCTQLEDSLLDPKLVSFPFLSWPVQANESNINLTTHPNATNEEKSTTILHPSSLLAYSNAISISFAAHHEYDLYMNRSAQMDQLFFSTVRPVQFRHFFALHLQYITALQLLHALAQHSKPSYNKRLKVKADLAKYKATMNHLELTPALDDDDDDVDETPAKLGVLAIFLLLDCYSTLTLAETMIKAQESTGKRMHAKLDGEDQSPITAGSDNAHSSIQNQLATRLKTQSKQVHGYQRFVQQYFPPSNEIFSTMLSTLQFLQFTFPYEIQSQLLHSKFYSHPFGFNLIEAYRVFDQMSIKQIQLDTLTYLVPTQNGLIPFDTKISTIIAKQIASFHDDFATSDSSGFEAAFTHQNSFQAISMNSLSQRVNFSTTFFNAFFTLGLNEAVFVNPTKINHGVMVIDSLYDDEYELFDPVAELQKKKKEARRKQQDATASTTTSSTSNTKTKSMAEMTPAEKKAAAAKAAQQKTKTAAGGAKAAVAPTAPVKPVYEIEPNVNPQLPVHLQSLQLITDKHHESITAEQINHSLFSHFAQFFEHARTISQSRYLPTMLPSPLQCDQKVAVSAPLNFLQLLLFITNRQDNNDFTPLITPTLFVPSSATSIPHSRCINEANQKSNTLVNVPSLYSIQEAVAPHPSLYPTHKGPSHDIDVQHSLLHPLTHTHALNYQNGYLFPSATVVLRDVATSRSLLNDFQFASDETGAMLRFKFLHEMLIFALSSHVLYASQNDMDVVSKLEDNQSDFVPPTTYMRCGIQVDKSATTPVTTQPFDLSIVLTNLVGTDCPPLPRTELGALPDVNTITPFDRLKYLSHWLGGTSISQWVHEYSDSISRYYKLIIATITKQYQYVDPLTQQYEEFILDFDGGAVSIPNIEQIAQTSGKEYLGEQYAAISFEFKMLMLTVEAFNILATVITVNHDQGGISAAGDDDGDNNNDGDDSDTKSNLWLKEYAKVCVHIQELFTSSTELLTMVMKRFSPKTVQTQHANQNEAQNARIEDTMTQLLHQNNYFDRILSLYITYLCPILVLIVQRYQLVTNSTANHILKRSLVANHRSPLFRNTDIETLQSKFGFNPNDETSFTGIGFLDVLSLLLTYQLWYNQRLTELISLPEILDPQQTDYVANIPETPPNDALFSMLTPSHHKKMVRILDLTPSIPLPVDIRTQQSLLVQHRIWNAYCLFETKMKTLYTLNAALFVPSYHKLEPQLPLGTIINNKAVPNKKKSTSRGANKPSIILPNDLVTALKLVQQTSNIYSSHAIISSTDTTDPNGKVPTSIPEVPTQKPQKPPQQQQPQGKTNPKTNSNNNNNNAKNTKSTTNNNTVPETNIDSSKPKRSVFDYNYQLATPLHSELPGKNDMELITSILKNSWERTTDPVKFATDPGLSPDQYREQALYDSILQTDTTEPIINDRGTKTQVVSPSQRFRAIDDSVLTSPAPSQTTLASRAASAKDDSSVSPFWDKDLIE